MHNFAIISAAIYMISSTSVALGAEQYFRGAGGVPYIEDASKGISVFDTTVLIENPDAPRVTLSFSVSNPGPATSATLLIPAFGGGVDATEKSAKLKNLEVRIDDVLIPTGLPEATTVQQRGIQFRANYRVAFHLRRGEVRKIIETYEGGSGGDNDGMRRFVLFTSPGHNSRADAKIVSVRCNFGRLSAYGPLSINPEGGAEHNNQLIWAGTSVNGSRELAIGWAPGFFNVSVYGRFPASNNPRVLRDNLPLAQVSFDKRLSVQPELRMSDVWLPATTAARWLGATVQPINGIRSLQIRKNTIIATVTVDSSIVAVNTGRRFRMVRKSTSAFAPLYPTQRYTMISLRTLVQALGGRYSFDSRRRFVKIFI